MLQHNTARRPDAAGRAHVAHAAMISLHVLCCALPLLALLVSGLLGASASVLAFSTLAGGVHEIIHAREVAIIGVSAILLVIGAALEWGERTTHANRGFPWLLALSAGCFVFNLVLVGAHRFA